MARTWPIPPRTAPLSYAVELSCTTRAPRFALACTLPSPDLAQLSQIASGQDTGKGPYGFLVVSPPRTRVNGVAARRRARYGLYGSLYRDLDQGAFHCLRVVFGDRAICSLCLQRYACSPWAEQSIAPGGADSKLKFVLFVGRSDSAGDAKGHPLRRQSRASGAGTP